MDFNTLEIIGLAFLAGLNIAEVAENVVNEEETEKVESEGKHCKDEKEADIKIEVGKLEGDKAKEFMNLIKKVTGEDKK